MKAGRKHKSKAERNKFRYFYRGNGKNNRRYMCGNNQTFSYKYCKNYS